MLTKIPIDIIKEIIYYLSNESILKLESSCQTYTKFRTDKFLLSNLINREHPIVFNICDNFCKQCNWVSYIKIKNKKNSLMCYHY